jgi:hypothetical protein
MRARSKIAQSRRRIPELAQEWWDLSEWVTFGTTAQMKHQYISPHSYGNVSRENQAKLVPDVKRKNRTSTEKTQRISPETELIKISKM